MEKKKLVIIGWGFGWLRTFWNLADKPYFDITLIDSRAKALVRPMMPEVAYEGKSVEDTLFPLRPIIEGKGHTFLNSEVVQVKPKENKVVLKDWTEIDYDYLVIATWAKKDFDAIPGLEEYGYSVCDDIHAPKIWERLQTFEGGQIWIGSAPSKWWTRVKIPNWIAPCEWPIWESMFMIEHYLREKWLRDKSEIHVFTPGEIFFEDVWDTVRWAVGMLMEKKWLKFYNNKKIKEIQKDKIVFEDGTEYACDMAIIIPVYRGPDFVLNSEWLGDEVGLIPTDLQMRHLDFDNIFAAWDVNANTMPKLGHLAIKQADIVSATILKDMGEDIEIPEYRPEVLCIMKMGGKEAGAVWTDIAFPHENKENIDAVWHWMQIWRLKDMFDWYYKTFHKMPPHLGEKIFKWMIKTFGISNKKQKEE